MTELATPKSWEEYRTLICERWATTVKAIMELARVCADAEATLDAKDFDKLIKALPFNASKLSMLRGIGSDARLYDIQVMANLPPSYSTIYQAHLLNDEELAYAVESRLLSPNVRREDIERLRLKRGYSRLRPPTSEIYKLTDVPGMEKPGTVPPQFPLAEEEAAELLTLGELKIPRNFDRIRELHEAILGMVHKFGVEFVPRPSREAAILHKHEEILSVTVDFLKLIGKLDVDKAA